MNTDQLNFLMPGAIDRPKMVEPELISRCPTKRDAIRLCIHMSTLKQKTVADRLDIDPGQFSRILSGQAHFPDDKYLDLYSICGNYAPLQWEAMKAGFSLDHHERRRVTDFGGRRAAPEMQVVQREQSA